MGEEGQKGVGCPGEAWGNWDRKRTDSVSDSSHILMLRRLIKERSRKGSREEI